MFSIAIIGTVNIGSALATKWAQKGHKINLGVRDKNKFKGFELLKNKNTYLYNIKEAVSKSEIILIATPASHTIEVVKSLGDTSNKIIIDSMNIVGGNGPQGYTNTADAILDNTSTDKVIKCFNSTGFNNIINPTYNNINIDMFMAGNNKEAKNIVRTLALDCGFQECFDFGDNTKFTLLEQFALIWINLAIFNGNGREIAFKLLKRGNS